MFDIYLLTRISALHDACAAAFAFCVLYWIVRGVIAGFRVLDPEFFETFASAAIWLRKATWVVVVVMALAAVGATILPDRTDVMLMVGNKAAANVVTAIESK